MKDKIIQISILIIIVISIIFISETAIFADSNIEISLESQAKSTKNISIQAAEPCIEPPLVVKNLEKHNSNIKLLKDSETKLAFVSSDGIDNISYEEYLIGVVMAEIPYTYEPEAIKAQAVAARTYTLYVSESGSRHAKNTVCNNSSHCSGFLSKNEYAKKYGQEAAEKAYSIAKKAVNDTDGQIMMYDSKPCCAVYHASSYGTTENSYNLWGTSTPYLKSVKTPETTSISRTLISEEKMRKFLKFYGRPNNEYSSIQFAYNDSGRSKNITIAGITFKTEALRSHFALRSSDVYIEYSDDGYLITTYGYGHGIGMSQVGANELAKQGYNYREILTHYYTGVEITEK